ncbi:Competence protein ComM [Anatilimnocola aggregata]|uniref:Competence protein ComM n=1 Tax=Anatilimnocola aggregata TaxID=2528021 RepID=A0A517YK53_9BACT|nr:ATP-binding protein [Anatilimnocola aggregata]QDU30605.1 Competence protein ComM [Anatilimnocola aggregata]
MLCRVAEKTSSDQAPTRQICEKHGKTAPLVFAKVRQLPQIERYMAKISGPLIDRIDLHMEVPAVPYKELSAERAGTSSAQMREQVVAARAIQATRFTGVNTRYNAHMSSRLIRQFCKLTPPCQELIKASVNDLGLSARAHDKVLRVARTIADLEASDAIDENHLSEAINYRMLDRQMWT